MRFFGMPSVILLTQVQNNSFHLLTNISLSICYTVYLAREIALDKTFQNIPKQSRQIHFAIWTNTFCNLDKCNWKIRQMHLIITDKYQLWHAEDREHVTRGMKREMEASKMLESGWRFDIIWRMPLDKVRVQSSMCKNLKNSPRWVGWWVHWSV